MRLPRAPRPTTETPSSSRRVSPPGAVSGLVFGLVFGLVSGLVSGLVASVGVAAAPVLDERNLISDAIGDAISDPIRDTFHNTIGVDVDVDVDEPEVRITVRAEERETTMRAHVTLRGNDVLPLGHTQVDEVGVDGVRHEIVEVILHDGVPVDERVVTVAERPPTPTIMSIGMSTSTAAGRDWAALARCESGGDPTIVSASGRYHGLYQFDVPTWESVGGTGLPSEASPDEQSRRAIALYEQRGASPWPTCGRHL